MEQEKGPKNTPLSPNPNPKLSHTAGRATIFLFLLILMCDFADQAMLNALLNPLLDDFFGNRDNIVPLGWVTFTFTILSAISMIIAGIYADRGSRKKICIAGSLLYSTFSILTILTPHGEAGYWFFFITRALNGIGIGAIIPTIFSMVGDTVEPEKRATAFAYINVAILIGRMMGLIVAGSLGTSWRIGYFSIGVINLILTIGLFRIKEPKRGSREKELENVLALDGAEYNFIFEKEDLRKLWSNKSNLWLIMNFIDVIPGAIILFFIFKYMEDKHNVPPEAVNVIILLVMIFGIFGTILFGKLGDKWFQKDRRAKAAIALFCNIFPIIFVFGFLNADFVLPDDVSVSEAFTNSVLVGVTVALVVGLFINQGVGPNWYSSVVDVNLPENRATMISLASFMDLLGNAIGPLIGAYIATIYGLQTAMWSIIIFWILNVLFWIPVFYYIRKDLDTVHDTLAKRAEEIQRKIGNQ